MNRHRVLLGVVCVAVSGCASTVGSHRTLQPLRAGIPLSKYTELRIEVEHDQGLAVLPSTRERISDTVSNLLQMQAPHRFRRINAESQGADTLVAKVLLTRYQEGNRLARGLLGPGLGAAHIAARVSLLDGGDGRLLSEHEVKKTFAWGGVYGQTQRIEDIEEGFCKAICAVILEGG